MRIVRLLIAFLFISSIVAEPVTNFKLFGLTEKEVVFFKEVQQAKEEVLFLLVFATIPCENCDKLIPELRKLRDKFPGKIKLYVIFTDDGNTSIQKAKNLKVLGDSYQDSMNALQKKFQVENRFPTTIVINKQKEILQRFEGYSKEELETLKNSVKK